MTNTRAAVGVQRLIRRLFACLGVVVLGAALAGCESSGSIFGANPLTAATPEPVAAAPTKATLSFAPIVGAPTDVSSKLSGSVVSAVSSKNVPVASGSSGKPDYTVHGFLVAAAESAGTKISYIWDVRGPDGNRAHRISGEEIIQGKPAKDPWTKVDQAVIDKIAGNTSTQLAAWVPTKAPAASTAAVAQAPAAGATTTPQPVSLSTPSTASNSGKLVDGQVVAATPAAAAGGKFGTIVPAVVGAPGDGASSLTQAIQRQLSTNGVALTQTPGPSAYTVQGRVQMGPPTNGKQAIKIEWQVLDPAGKRVGAVTQNNVVPQGSLDGPWGRVAEAAAGAAAKGILKLLPNKGVN